jgi:hypothetical protein
VTFQAIPSRPANPIKANLAFPLQDQRPDPHHELGSYEVLGLADARKTVKELRAQVALGRDPSGEKQERKAVALAKIEEAKNVRTVGQLADEYFMRMIEGRLKHPNVVKNRIEKDIRPALGTLPVSAMHWLTDGLDIADQKRWLCQRLFLVVGAR